MDEVFPVRVPVPDLRDVAAGNAGIPGVWHLDSGRPGPRVVIVSLMHGNEFQGASVLARWLRAGLRPARGALTLVFANLDAFSRFDPADPTLSRYVDEDLNRVWSPALLDGGRDSLEMRRARALRPVVEAAEVLLDLHSMLWPSDPVMIVGRDPAALALARAAGAPPPIVVDGMRPEGPRLIDHAPFAVPGTGRLALLVEAGQHWEPETEMVAEACASGLLRALGMLPPAAPVGSEARGEVWTEVWPEVWTVSGCVVAASRGFCFTRPFRGGAVIPRAGTLIARDGEAEIRTPHDDCMLVMPSPRVMRGHVAVRLARRAPPGRGVQVTPG
ncbi:succinylglutamate desuccinylase/aspartoacylase domain-containing protein [Pararoseomonas indoligenes]|uniref:Succinylglutamate desuccinylase/aspartoacylase family protein n=1 Tax=Roseomonas indoligenes TaxID=2820811 RepID=A0A940MT95_9PROT|nr:succinylglutamate desuccinylase/aspartoacylase family protein [Pararoseomonas indoligenes]MBP0491511.1 succinylglutamate desuccinylase/aspartoacylase family protein [Pararoseomonas indoligenes]